MSRLANQFTDPMTGETYVWPINHNQEDTNAKQQNLNVSAPTSALGLMPVQAQSNPLVLQWSGVILTRAQLQAMMHWYAKCLGNPSATPVVQPRTIYLTDFAGDEYEGMIVNFDPTRAPVAKNPREPTLNVIWNYKLHFHVIRQLAGDWIEITP